MMRCLGRRALQSCFFGPARWPLLSLVLFALLALLLYTEAFAAPQAPAPFDVLHYDAEIRVNPSEKTLTGIVSIRFKSLVNNLSELELDAQELSIEEVSEQGAALVFEAKEGRLNVRLARAARAGEVRTLKIRYRAKPTRGFKFYDDHFYAAYNTPRWMVCRFDPGDKATLFLRLQLPAEIKAVVANGNPVEKRSLPGNWTEHAWHEDSPIPPYIFGFAAGQFQEVVSRKDSVQLFLLARAPYTTADIEKIFADTRDMFSFYEKRAGVRYAGRRYTQVLASGNVMQEMSGFTVLRENYGREVLAEPRENWLIAHELAHQWWGNRVTCLGWADFWLNEGFAEFMMSAYREHRFGRDEYDRDMELARMTYARIRTAGRDRPLAYRKPIKESEAGGPVVYDKGALVLNLLRYELGERAFWDGVRRYTRRHFNGSVVTSDLQKAMEEASGKSLAQFFEQWIYSAGVPDVAARHQVENGEVVIDIEQRQERLWTLVFEIALETSGGRESRRVLLKDRRMQVRFKLAGKLLSVRLDQGGRLPFNIIHERPVEMLLYQLAREPDTPARADALRQIQTLRTNASTKEDVRAQLKAALEERFAKDSSRLIRELARRALAE